MLARFPRSWPFSSKPGTRNPALTALPMTDSLQPFVFEGAGVRGGIVRLGATWRAVLERRHYPPALRETMGELMAAAALLASNLKFEGSMIMQMQGGGP